jgi:hypothetical protein
LVSSPSPPAARGRDDSIMDRRSFLGAGAAGMTIAPLAADAQRAGNGGTRRVALPHHSRLARCPIYKRRAYHQRQGQDRRSVFYRTLRRATASASSSVKPASDSQRFITAFAVSTHGRGSIVVRRFTVLLRGAENPPEKVGFFVCVRCSVRTHS